MHYLSKLAFAQILMSTIKLSITLKIGQFALIRCYTCAKKKPSIFFCKVPLALSNSPLSYTADLAIIEKREMK